MEDLNICMVAPTQTLPTRRLALMILVQLCLGVFAVNYWSIKFISIDMGKEGSIIQTSTADNMTSDSLAHHQGPSSPLSNFVLHGAKPFPDRPSLPPLDMLQTYISQHSERSLRGDFQKNNTDYRRFAIVHYSCPQQFGNRMHHFYNDFLLAFLTNRTILWRYWDRETCVQLGNNYDHEICVDGNRSLSIDDPQQACGHIMSTALWMPRYEDWSKRLDLPEPEQIWIRPINPHNAPHPTPEGVERIRWVADAVGRATNRSDVGVSSDLKIVVFQPLVGVLGPAFVEKQLTQNPYHLSRVQALFGFGSEFWYGLLFDHAFRLHPEFLSTVEPSTRLFENDDLALSAMTIALHSRHTDPSDDGTNITEELNCLKSLIREMELLNLTSCRLFMLSDRPQTLMALAAWFSDSAVACTVVQARHDAHAKEAGLEAEHGPFAGAGFVRDLELASEGASKSLNAAWIGHGRSSSKLLLEWVTYRRAIRLWRDYGVVPDQLPKVSRCQLSG